MKRKSKPKKKNVELLQQFLNKIKVKPYEYTHRIKD